MTDRYTLMDEWIIVIPASSYEYKMLNINQKYCLEKMCISDISKTLVIIDAITRGHSNYYARGGVQQFQQMTHRGGMG